jgi:hypothetical protein
MIHLVNRHPPDPKGVSAVELFLFIGLAAAIFAALAAAFGSDSRDSFDQDPTQAFTVRYAR